MKPFLAMRKPTPTKELMVMMEKTRLINFSMQIDLFTVTSNDVRMMKTSRPT